MNFSTNRWQVTIFPRGACVSFPNGRLAPVRCMARAAPYWRLTARLAERRLHAAVQPIDILAGVQLAGCIH